MARYRKTELVEWSIVALPSNRDSLVEAVRMATCENMNAAQARDFLSLVLKSGMGELPTGVDSHVGAGSDDPWQPFMSLVQPR